MSTTPRVVVGFHAHPDDESLVTGGTLVSWIVETQRDRVVEQRETLRRDLIMIQGTIAVYRQHVVDGDADRLWSAPNTPP